jgi:hypothetical protein
LAALEPPALQAWPAALLLLLQQEPAASAAPVRPERLQAEPQVLQALPQPTLRELRVEREQQAWQATRPQGPQVSLAEQVELPPVPRALLVEALAARAALPAPRGARADSSRGPKESRLRQGILPQRISPAEPGQAAAFPQRRWPFAWGEAGCS